MLTDPCHHKYSITSLAKGHKDWTNLGKEDMLVRIEITTSVMKWIDQGPEA